MGKQIRRRKGQTYADKLARERRKQETKERLAADVLVKVRSDMRTQIAQWLMVVTMNDVFGIGPLRFSRDYAPGLDERIEWFNNMVKEGDLDYAKEKLRLEAQRVTGSAQAFAHDDLLAEARRRYGADRNVPTIGETECWPGCEMGQA